MTAALRKGWCPGALRPMPAKDGLLVRLRITSGILSAAQAIAVAHLAERCGNGLLDLSARANLQIRGVEETTLAVLQDGLAAIDLLDRNRDAEAVRNVIASPLAGLHDGLDVRPLVAALEARLVTTERLRALPPKFGFLVDDDSRPSLADVPADVRFDWNGKRFAIGLGGTRSQATLLGYCEADEVPDRAVQAAEAFLATTPDRFDMRRMHQVKDAVAKMCGAPPTPARQVADGVDSGFDDEKPPESAQRLVGLRSLSCPTLGLAAPFGRLDAAMLRAAAQLARSTGFGELRLTPWRVILVPGVDLATDTPGFITDPSDRRLSIASCFGAAGCTRATTNVTMDATHLAAALPSGVGVTLHVSGCEKGCAKPSSTVLTLVARDGRYDIVRNGRAGDPPWRRGLDLAGARDALRDLA